MRHFLCLLFLGILGVYAPVRAQSAYALDDYELQLQAVAVDNLPGLHSYAFAQHQGRWLVLGGRLDGLHARQPWASFPASSNNTQIFVVDVALNQFWAASLDSLSVSLREQLQSTNMNFYQDADTLYFLGGYAFSATANDHITFPYLTSIRVSELMNAVVQGQDIRPYFQQIQDTAFAVTGGQLGQLDEVFYLVGGHRFDGRYNPMNNPTFTQSYTNQIRRFKFHNHSANLHFSDYNSITDPVHLHRRDYNLLPQIFPDGRLGYTISSGVFQVSADLPFLYPVNLDTSGHQAVTTFNQYLSNYHGAKVCVYDSSRNEMHSLFFGGMSQYYYDAGQLIRDDLVPFVNTISRLTRYADSSLQEFKLAQEMPSLKGASSEFIFNPNLPHSSHKVIKLNAISTDSILLGHIYGGIQSPSRNPFSNNQTSTTSADPTIYAVWLIRRDSGNTGLEKLPSGRHGFKINAYPNPLEGNTLQIDFDLAQAQDQVHYFLSDKLGRVLAQGQLGQVQQGHNKQVLNLPPNLSSGLYTLTWILNHKYYYSQQLLKP